jgi:hypothetical protein
MESVSIENPGAVINSLQRRIEQLEAQLSAAREYNAQAVPSVVGDAIKRLRLHGVILLQLGSTNAPMERELNENALLDAAYRQVWMLDRAPVAQDVKEAIRTAANNGMDRW